MPLSEIKVRARNQYSRKPRSSRIGLKPLTFPARESYWILRDNPRPTSTKRGHRAPDPIEYRIVVVTQAMRGYARAGHQSITIEFVPAKFHVEYGLSDRVAHVRYSCSGDEFEALYRPLEDEDELDDELAMLLLANV